MRLNGIDGKPPNSHVNSRQRLKTCRSEAKWKAQMPSLKLRVGTELLRNRRTNPSRFTDNSQSTPHYRDPHAMRCFFSRMKLLLCHSREPVRFLLTRNVGCPVAALSAGHFQPLQAQGSWPISSRKLAQTRMSGFPDKRSWVHDRLKGPPAAQSNAVTTCGG